jgi:hypothetical protein
MLMVTHMLVGLTYLALPFDSILNTLTLGGVGVGGMAAYRAAAAAERGPRGGAAREYVFDIDADAAAGTGTGAGARGGGAGRPRFYGSGTVGRAPPPAAAAPAPAPAPAQARGSATSTAQPRARGTGAPSGSFSASRLPSTPTVDSNRVLAADALLARRLQEEEDAAYYRGR